MDAKIAEAGRNPCEGITRRRACDSSAKEGVATALEGLNAQKMQLATDLQESANEVLRVNAPIEARIDEVMNRVDGGGLARQDRDARQGPQGP